MSELALLKYPKKSHRKPVRLPSDSARLTEFIGIMMGDGGIGNPWQATITVNAVADKKYAEYVSALCVELFAVAPTLRKRRDQQALVISIAGTSLIDFLISKGLPRGNKLKQGLEIPAWILSNPSFLKACIRGLVDTDGCLYIHKHSVAGKRYENLGFCFTTYSPKLLTQVARAFEDFGIMPHISTKRRDIYLYRADAVAKYLEIFGTSNERISAVYEKWRGGRVV